MKKLVLTGLACASLLVALPELAGQAEFGLLGAVRQEQPEHSPDHVVWVAVRQLAETRKLRIQFRRKPYTP